MFVVPAILFFGFIPFSIVLEEIFGPGLFFFCAMVIYVFLFPLSPVIVGGILYGGERHLAIEEAGDPEVADRWKLAGRARISELELGPQSQADFISEAIFPNRSPLQVEEE